MNIKCVYCLEFPDGKRYVGSTKNLKRRLTNHQSAAHNKEQNPELKEAVLQGGYEVIILEQCPDNYTRKQLEAREQHYVNIWFDHGILYNKRKAVRGGWNRGVPAWNRGIPRTQEVKAKISAAKKGKPVKKYSLAYQRADEIKADKAAGMQVIPLMQKYNCGWNVLTDILAS